MILKRVRHRPLPCGRQVGTGARGRGATGADSAAP